jgi:tetratricopeptide (TPR) repeat protein
VAYGSLLQERRRALHALIVEAIEGLYADRLTDQVERLAHHAVRGEVWDKALAYCRQAGGRAAARSAYREAVVYFEQALAGLAKLPERRDTLEQAIDLRGDLRNAFLPLSEYARMLDHLHAAESLAERLGDSQRLGRIACYLCNALSVIGEHDSAMAAGQRALALATTSGAFDIQVMAQTHLGIAYSTVGDFRQALDISRQAMMSLTGELRYAHFGQVALAAVVSRGHITWSLAELGDFAEGNGVGEEAVRIAEEAEEPFSLAIALTWVGLLSRRQGALHRAIPLLERGLALSQTADFPESFSVIAPILGATFAFAGHIAQALPLLDQTLERVATGSSMRFQALGLTEMSEALLLVGRMDEANALARRLLELSRTYPGRGYQAYACRLLGEVAMHREPPDVDQAAGHYRQAITLAEEIGMRPLQAHCHLGLGRLYNQTGHGEQARLALSTALDLYLAMDMRFWLPQAEAALAQAVS